MSEITREAIINATNYGVNIYAHILRECFPYDSPIMTIRCRDCGICRNPFANGHPTLHIFIEKSVPGDAMSSELARHTTTDHSIPDGDAIFFAEHYYHIEGEQLYELLNKELCLHLDEPLKSNRPLIEWLTEEEQSDTESPLPDNGIATLPIPQDDANMSGNVRKVDCDRQVSRFSFFKAPITNLSPYKHITLVDAYNYITGRFAKKRTEVLRSLRSRRTSSGDNFYAQKTARTYKATYFDYCTFSGTFFNRNDKALIKHSGLLCLDFDHIGTPCAVSTNSEKSSKNEKNDNGKLEEIRSHLLQDKYFKTQLLFRSPSGDGLKWVIEIFPDFPDPQSNHVEYFTAIANYIRSTYGVEVDKSGKNISRACFLPNDPECYINPEYL